MGGRAAVVALAVLGGLAAQDAKPTLEVIRVSRSDGGGTTRFDSGRVEKNYRDAVAVLEQALSRYEKEAVARMEDGSLDSAAAGGLAQDKYDAGLPDPTRTVRRTFRPSMPLPEPLRGATITVVTLDRNGVIQGLPKAPLRRSDVVLVSRAARLKDCARLGRVTFLTPELAASLGLRASRGRCVVSADGTKIEITEGDLP